MRGRRRFLVVGVLTVLVVLVFLQDLRVTLAPRLSLEQQALARLSSPAQSLHLDPVCPESSSGNISLLMPYNQSIPAGRVWLDPSGRAARNDTWAICAYEGHRPHAAHLPHCMQQLYKCFSFWEAHRPEKKPVLLHRIKEHSLFVKGFNQALQEAFGVRWIREVLNEDGSSDTSSIEQFNTSAVIPAPVPAYALLSADHARALSAGILQHYFHKPPTTSCHRHSPRIGILNRAKSRIFLNVDALQNVLEEQFNTTVQVSYFEGSKFLDQVHFFASHDIIVSPHGAQLTGLPFLPACSGLLEVFPAKYYVANYFQDLARSSGVYHATLYLSNASSPGGETAVARQKGLVDHYRSASLCPPVTKIVQGVTALVQLHEECCGRTRHR